MLDHTKLRAFEMADEVVVLVYQVTTGFPKKEMYGLTSPVVTRILSDNGSLIAEIYEERRIVVPVARMPRRLIEAFVPARR